MVLAAKLACIEVAGRNAVLGDRLNHSQISAITGLTRREVKSLSSVVRQDADYTPGRSTKQRIDRVLTGWTTDPDFLDRKGEPLVLATKLANSSFRALVRKYAGDVTPMSVLREMQRVGAVYRTTDGRLRLRKSHLRAKGFSSHALAEISRHVGDLGTTLVSNLGATVNPSYAAFQNVQGLTADEAALFQATFSERMASLLSSVSTWVRGQTRLRSRIPLKNTLNPIDVGIGVYLVRRDKIRSKPVRRSNATRLKR
jgi:hypothetical protein